MCNLSRYTWSNLAPSFPKLGIEKVDGACRIVGLSASSVLLCGDYLYRRNADKKSLLCGRKMPLN